jgi:hypothetical protein
MNRPPLETEDELKLVKDYLLLPVVLDVLERDIRTLDTLKLKMPQPYIRSLRTVQNKVTADMATIRRGLRGRGIKVYAERRTKRALEADYVCRGYHRKFSMLWGVVKAEVQQKLCRYLDVDLAP